MTAFFKKLFVETLKPTERELLEADAAWWKDSSGYWQAAWKQADAEVAKLSSVLDDIHTQGHDSKSGTARAMASKAWKALKS